MRLVGRALIEGQFLELLVGGIGEPVATEPQGIAPKRRNAIDIGFAIFIEDAKAVAFGNHRYALRALRIVMGEQNMFFPSSSEIVVQNRVHGALQNVKMPYVDVTSRP